MVLIASRKGVLTERRHLLRRVGDARRASGVALLTPASVACADSTTATRSVNGFTYWSSLRGSGLACRRRRNSSAISSRRSLVPDLAGTASFPAAGAAFCRLASAGCLLVLTVMTAEDTGGRPGERFRAILLPHRSLGRKGFIALMAVVCLVSAFAAVRFYQLGAWPVVTFFGVNVLLIYGAFRLNYRAAKLYELIELTASELRLTRVYPSGHSQSWSFNPYWVPPRTGRARGGGRPPQPALSRPGADLRQFPER